MCPSLSISYFIFLGLKKSKEEKMSFSELHFYTVVSRGEQKKTVLLVKFVPIFQYTNVNQGKA